MTRDLGISHTWKKVKVLVVQACLTLCDPMDCSLPDSSLHRTLQARILEWVAISFSRGSSWPRDWTWVSSIAVRLFTVLATREVIILFNSKNNPAIYILQLLHRCVTDIQCGSVYRAKQLVKYKTGKKTMVCLTVKFNFL